MTSFERAFRAVLGIEGGYSDHPADRGGKTRFGITEATARAAGYAGSMAELPVELAQDIYRDRYWDALRLEEVAALSAPLAHELFDSAVNCGVTRAGRWLQQSLNVLNAGGAHYADLVVDGAVGPRTIAALRAYLVRRGADGERVLLRALNCLQGAHYIELSAVDPRQEAFTFGWFLHRVVI